jgi:hydrogenase expression/formation protein HypE
MPVGLESLSCPVPHDARGIVQLAHGGGGRWMQRLLDEVIYPALGNPILDHRHDSALLALANGAQPQRRLAFTTDSYVVRPLFFPGGDIGSLAINGTLNDLAMSGARPLWLSAAFILEEGLPLDTLARICASMRRAADAAGVSIVTGDTKVVDRGKGDGVYINTAGVGIVEHEQTWEPRQVRPGDAIILSGDVGRHGMAIVATREGIEFETALESDCASVAGLVIELLQCGTEAHCLRDLTRGGLVSALVEIAEVAGLSMRIEEDAIPITEEVRVACELLGFDPLHVACEGRFIAIVPPLQAEHTLQALRAHPLGREARMIGEVTSGDAGLVVLRNRLGTARILDMLSGEQLPRIC